MMDDFKRKTNLVVKEKYVRKLKYFTKIFRKIKKVSLVRTFAHSLVHSAFFFFNFMKKLTYRMRPLGNKVFFTCSLIQRLFGARQIFPVCSRAPPHPGTHARRLLVQEVRVLPGGGGDGLLQRQCHLVPLRLPKPGTIIQN